MLRKKLPRTATIAKRQQHGTSFKKGEDWSNNQCRSFAKTSRTLFLRFWYALFCVFDTPFIAFFLYENAGVSERMDINVEQRELTDRGLEQLASTNVGNATSLKYMSTCKYFSTEGNSISIVGSSSTSFVIRGVCHLNFLRCPLISTSSSYDRQTRLHSRT